MSSISTWKLFREINNHVVAKTRPTISQERAKGNHISGTITGTIVKQSLRYRPRGTVLQRLLIGEHAYEHKA
jgi:hypothetical protein